jgi:hypothetical protein
MKFNKKSRSGHEAYMRKRIESLEAAVLKTRIINLVLLIGLGVVAFFAVGSFTTVKVQSAMITSLNSTIDTKDQEYKDLEGELEASNTTISEMTDNMKKLAFTAVNINSELNTLKTDYNDKVKKLEQLEEREELFDQYEYVLFDDYGNRTDVTYQRIKNVQEYADEQGLSDDAVKLIFALVDTESEGDAKVKNSDSTATGLGQLLIDTARYVYEEEMGNGAGTYTHNMALDPDTNLQMVTSYIGYLAKQYKDPTQVLYAYRGTSEDYYYVDKVNKKLGDDLTLASLKLLKPADMETTNVILLDSNGELMGD